MSDNLFPLEVWQSGTNENSLPANTNALRVEALSRNVISNVTTSQPGSPNDGDVYIIASTHTGSQWAGFTPDDLAIYRGGTWYAFGPVDGMTVNLNGTLYEYAGSAGWTALSPGTVIVPIIVACSDETTALTTGTAKATFRMPYAYTLTGVRASVTTAPTGSAIQVDINQNGSSILSTKLTIDATEKTSTTAATPAVISDSSLDDDAEITIDIDAVGSTIAGTGLKVTLLGNS